MHQFECTDTLDTNQRAQNDLAVEPFEPINRVEFRPMVDGEAHAGEHVVLGFIHERRSLRAAHSPLEKDVWVVWALATLYGSPLGEHLAFKGGTSLSKAYGAIRRCSEDVDLTYDIRAIAPDLVGVDSEALPKTRSEEERRSSAVGQIFSEV